MHGHSTSLRSRRMFAEPAVAGRRAAQFVAIGAGPAT